MPSLVSGLFSAGPPIVRPVSLWRVLAAPVAVLVLAALQPWWTYGELFNDPFATLRVSPATGLVSNLGAFLWCAAASVALFGFAAARRVQGGAGVRRFLLWTGVFTLWLMLDDFFMLHEYALPFGLGIGERYVMVLYVLVAAAYAFAFRRTLLRLDRRLLLAAATCMGGSLVLDRPVLKLVHRYAAAPIVQYLLEDGLKFVGTALWLAYVASGALALLEEASGAKGPARDAAATG